MQFLDSVPHGLFDGNKILTNFENFGIFQNIPKFSNKIFVKVVWIQHVQTYLMMIFFCFFLIHFSRNFTKNEDIQEDVFLPSSKPFNCLSIGGNSIRLSIIAFLPGSIKYAHAYKLFLNVTIFTALQRTKYANKWFLKLMLANNFTFSIGQFL